MLNLVLAIHIFIAIIVIVLVLVQHGKGADMGASFGSGSSQTVFGSRGAAPFLMKLTAVLAALFFVSSLTMGYLSKEYVDAANTLSAPVPQHTALPVTPAQTQPRSAPVAPLRNKAADSGVVPKIPEGK